MTLAARPQGSILLSVSTVRITSVISLCDDRIRYLHEQPDWSIASSCELFQYSSSVYLPPHHSERIRLYW